MRSPHGAEVQVAESGAGLVCYGGVRLALAPGGAIAVRRGLIFALVVSVVQAPWVSDGGPAAANATGKARRAVGNASTDQGLPLRRRRAVADSVEDAGVVKSPRAADLPAPGKRPVPSDDEASWTPWRWGPVGASCSEVCPHGCAEHLWPSSKGAFEAIVGSLGVACSSVGTGSWTVNPGRDEGTHQCWWSSLSASDRCGASPVFYRRLCPCQRSPSRAPVRSSLDPPRQSPCFEEVTGLVAAASSEEPGREAVHVLDAARVDGDGHHREYGVWNAGAGANSSTWLQVDLGREEFVAAVQMWNYYSSDSNESIDCHGLRNFTVQAYGNGAWTTLAEQVGLAPAGVASVESYDGHAYKAISDALPSPYDQGSSEIADWLPVTARLLRFTDLQSYGSDDTAAESDSCYGLSEVKVFRLSETCGHPVEAMSFAAEVTTTTQKDPVREDDTRRDHPVLEADPRRDHPVIVDDGAEVPDGETHSVDSRSDRRAAEAAVVSDGWKSRWRQDGPPVVGGETMRSFSLVGFGLLCMTVALGALRHQLFPQTPKVVAPDTREIEEPEMQEEFYNLAVEAERQKVDAVDPVLSEPEEQESPSRRRNVIGGLRNAFFARKFQSTIRTPRGYLKTPK